MAVTRDQPYCNANFMVDFGRGEGRSVRMGFAEVVFPPFPVAVVEGGEGPADFPAGDLSSAPPGHVILKRGVTGSLDLYGWWNRARHGRAPKRRTVKIELLSEDHATVVMTWRFRNARPVSLFYSPLRAMEGGVLMETLVIAFDGMIMS